MSIEGLIQHQAFPLETQRFAKNLKSREISAKNGPKFDERIDKTLNRLIDYKETI